MEKKTEMESPLAQDCVVTAQEDSTSVDPGIEAIGDKKVIDDTPSLLSDNSSVDVNCHKEILTFPNTDTSIMESTLAKSSSTAVQEQNFTEQKPYKERLDNQCEEVTLKCKDCKNDVSTESASFPVSRKRPATDFFPINAEIKKIGVEISEEQAELLKNEVRRLSPIHVSLRERTLGEISLISDPRIFVDEQDRFALKEDGELSSSASESEIQEDRLKTYGIRGLMNSDNRFGKLGNIGETRMGGCDEKSLDKHSMLAENKLESRLDSIVLNENGISVRVEPTTPSKENSRGIRELALVLSRVDVVNSPIKKNGISVEGFVNIKQDSCLEKKKEVISDKREDNEQSGEPEVNSSRTLSLTDKVMGLVTERCASYVHDGITSRSEVLIEKKLDVNNELSVGDIGSPRKTIQILVTDEIQRVSKIEENQENVFVRSPFEVDESHPEIAGQQPSELRTIPTSIQSQESVDTEEMETGSNISEVIASITTVQFLNDHHHVIANPIPSSENEPPICDDIPPEIMTRLETERPEAFTEDSAESLTLAAGSRDEVRSDGSDSGLGSEIPGDPRPTPVPESDCETSFLDRIPDEILPDKDKAVNQLVTFVPGINGQCTPTTSLPTLRTPSKSNLKRRLVDCMEGEPSAKRINTDEPANKKRNIHFDAVTVYYFPRTQGFTCVPSQGGSTLGMSATHTHAERFSLSEHAAEQRRLHRARLAQLRTERAANCVTEAASSSEDPSDDTDEEPSDTEELDIDSYYFLQPVPTWQRRALLRAAGVRRIDAVEKDECRDIRASREHCGCGCKGYCDPESCPCSRANVKCQVDRAGFPCGCSRDGCANSSGRIEFNPVRVRTHFIHTLMRLELDKKQRDEEHTEQDLMDNHHSGRGPLREVPLGSVMDNSADACINGGGFTTLHYENHDNIGPSCHQDVSGVREDSLDLYAIRDDCYPSDDAVDCSHNLQRKLHPEFHQPFQTFPGHPNPSVAFHQNAYADYQSYQNLPSTSRATFQPQFPLTGNSGFSHYGGYPTNSSMQVNCQTHPGQHATMYETPFAQDEVTASQYTNLNPVQPMNAVVHQTGKLEPFSELLANRYSYYGELDPQNHENYHTSVAKLETEKGEVSEQQTENTDECDENFGEIIKKSMVETVSA